MSIVTPYKWRSLVTWAGVKQHPAKELMFFMIRAITRAVPKLIVRLISLRLLRPLRDAVASATEDSPIVGMMVDSVEKIPGNESAIVSRLMTSFSAAKRRQRTISGPYQPGADWKKLLESQWARCQDAINRQDIGEVAAFLRNFFRNEGLSGFWGKDRMFEIFTFADGMASRRRANTMRSQFEAWREALPTASVAELDAPLIGNPWGYIIDGHLLYEPVFEYHYQANYFATLLSDIPNPVILEIGGGFGGLGYHILKRIRQVKYIGFDLPENVLIQSYYLSCAFPELKILIYEEGMTALTRDVIDKYDIIVLPNFMIPEVESEVADLAVNVRSLSEMPLETISEYLRQIGRLTKLFFFHENIFKRRLDQLHGIPSSDFPALSNFILVAESESRWPRYQKEHAYPCNENLYIHRSVMRR